MARLCAIVVLCLIAADVQAQWLNYRHPGAPRTPDGKVNLAAPVPRTPDGKPDLSGTWESEGGYFGNLAKDLKPGELLMQPWAEAQVASATSTRTIRWSRACRLACPASTSEAAG